MRHARVRSTTRTTSRPLWAALITASLLLTGSGSALADLPQGDVGAPLAAQDLSTTQQQPAQDAPAAPDRADATAEQPAAPVDDTAEAPQAPADPAPSNTGDTGTEDAAGEPSNAPAATDEQPTGNEGSPALDDEELLTDVESAGGDMAPMSVPTPTGHRAVINVNVGGDRTGDTSVGGLQGVTLRLYDGGSSGPTTPVGQDWATCVSDADGDCSFTIPDTNPQQDNRDRRFWVVQDSAPAGWYANHTLVTGGATNQAPTPYQFRTGAELQARTVYHSGSDFMEDRRSLIGARVEQSSGTWQVGRSNPHLPQTCQSGLNVALVLDLSGSVANAGATGDLKNAAIGFAEALEGTGSALALYTFATTAPRNNGASGRNHELMPIDGNLGTITSRINAYQAEGGTNWDRGIYQVATSSNNYDLAVVVTDGLPTFYGTGPNPPGPGSSTRFREVEEAIFSANALKAQGTRTLAVGVGDGISGNPANLAAISGPNGYAPGASINTTDYFQAAWQQLADLLEDVARGATCQASITINKTAEHYGGGDDPSGWGFEATHTGSGTLNPPDEQITDATGELEYTIQFDSMSATANVSITELISEAQHAEGWSLADLSCTGHDQMAIDLDNARASVSNLGVGDDVECTFTNVQHLVPGIDLVKRAWDTQTGPVDPADPGQIDEIHHGDEVAAGATITWTYTVTNTGQTSLENIAVIDDQGVEVTCPGSELPIGASMTCWGSGPVTADP